MGFTRGLEGKTLRIYLNRGCDNWNIPAGKVLLGHNMHTVAPNWLTLSPMGFCLTEDA